MTKSTSRSGIKHVAIRVDANHHIGLGHFFRCLSLARALRQIKNIDSTFFLLESSLISIVRRKLEENGFPYFSVSTPEAPWQDSPQIFFQHCRKLAPQGILLDLLSPDKDDQDLLQNICWHPADIGRYLAFADKTGTPSVLYSDTLIPMDHFGSLTINPSPTQNKGQYPKEIAENLLLGPAYHVMERAKDFPTPKFQPKNHLLAFFGGNDHVGFGDALVDCWQKRDQRPLLKIVVGAGTPDIGTVVEKFRAQGAEVLHNVSNMGSMFKSAKMVVTAGGTSLFDLAALGIPSAAVATRPRQAESIRWLAKNSACIDLGLGLADFTKDLPQLFDAMHNELLLERMSNAGQQLVDDRGSERIACAIESVIEKKESISCP